jgi:TRAP-type C4-dicarboxylate transport system substrate-binding protein
MPKFKAVILFLSAMIVGLPMVALSAEWTLDFQDVYGPGHPLHKSVILPWLEEIKKKSDGRLVLNYYPSGALVPDSERIKALRAGSIDMSALDPDYTPMLTPYSQGIFQPFIARDAEHGSAVAWKIYEEAEELRNEMSTGIKVLTMWTSDRCVLLSNDKQIMKPEDLKGKRVIAWPPWQPDVKSWGGIVVSATPGETYVAMQRGMGEVFYGPLPAIRHFKLQEVSKYGSIIPSIVGIIWIGVNQDIWDKLPDDLKKVLEETTDKDFGLNLGRKLKEITDQDVRDMSAVTNFITLDEAQIEPFKKLSRPGFFDRFVPLLKKAGVKDPVAWFKRVEEIAATVK